MKSVDQYPTLTDFTVDLDKKGPITPLKVMGKKRLPDPKTGKGASFYSISMLREIYRQTNNADLAPPLQSVPAPFGEILDRGARLFPDLTYSVIRPHSTGANHFQGDIIPMDLSDGGKKFPPHELSMILSHSCDIQKLRQIVVVPAFTESQLTEAVMTQIHGKKPVNHKKLLETWFSNEMAIYLGLPPIDLPGASGSERILVCLHLAVSVPKTSIVLQNTILRLKYRASSYLQSRICVLFMRDVQDSDETRDI